MVVNPPQRVGELIDQISQRAINWALTNFGTLSDLPRIEAHVIWVTVYRAMETSLEAENAGGSAGMTKDALAGGDLTVRLKEATLRLQFLSKILPQIRTARNVADSAMLVEMLKYGNLDAPDQSILKRAMARIRARVDPMYSSPIPDELYKRPKR